MESRYEDLTKEQLIAELNVATEKNKHLRDRVDVFEQAEKKREFERKLAEAKEFLTANGYEVRLMTAAERFPVDGSKLKSIDYQTMEGAVLVRKPERVWKDTDMKMFGIYCVGSPADESIHDTFDKFVTKIIPHDRRQ